MPAPFSPTKTVAPAGGDSSTGDDLLCAVDLLQQHHAEELVRKRHFAHGELFVGAADDVVAQAQRAADDKHHAAAVHLPAAEKFRQLHAVHLLAVDAVGHDKIVRADLAEDRFALFFLGYFACVLGQIVHFDNFEFHVAGQSLFIFVGGVAEEFFAQAAYADNYNVLHAPSRMC